MTIEKTASRGSERRSLQHAEAMRLPWLRLRTNVAQSRIVSGAGTFAVLAFSVIFPSLMLTEKYLGLWGSAIYALAAALLLTGWLRAWPAVERHVSERQALLLSIAALVVLAAVFILIYPIANTHVPGHGSDSDDALDQATRALLAGKYPYHDPTYLGSPITPLPGGLFLAVPFVLLAGSAYQTIPWLVLAYVLLLRLSGTHRAALWLMALAAISPGILHSIVTGSDHLANAAAVLTGSQFLIWSAEVSRWRARRALAIVLLGLSMAWRPNFFVLLVPLFFTLWRRGGRIAWDPILVVIVAGAVSLPFFLYDPSNFTPLHNMKRLNDVPWGTVTVPAVTGVIAAYLAWRCDGSSTRFLVAAFILLVTPFVLVVVPAVIRSHTFDAARFGVQATLFGLAAVASTMRDGTRASSQQMAA